MCVVYTRALYIFVSALMHHPYLLAEKLTLLSPPVFLERLAEHAEELSSVFCYTQILPVTSHLEMSFQVGAKWKEFV